MPQRMASRVMVWSVGWHSPWLVRLEDLACHVAPKMMSLLWKDYNVEFTLSKLGVSSRNVLCWMIYRSSMMIVGCIVWCWMIGFMVLSFLSTMVMYMWTSHSSSISKFRDGGGVKKIVFVTCEFGRIYSMATLIFLQWAYQWSYLVDCIYGLSVLDLNSKLIGVNVLTWVALLGAWY